jgi:hypothetical protein
MDDRKRAVGTNDMDLGAEPVDEFLLAIYNHHRRNQQVWNIEVLMPFTTQSTVSFGDLWSATQHNVMIANDAYVNGAFSVPLFPSSSGLAPSSGLTSAAFSQVQSSGAGANKPEFWKLSFDAAAIEGRIWSGRVPRGFGSTLTVNGMFYMASATSGNVVVAAQIACVSDTDTSVDAKVFATANSATVAVPAAAKKACAFSITMTNADSIAAGDFFTLAFYRDATSGSDTATGDMELIMLDVYFSLA